MTKSIVLSNEIMLGEVSRLLMEGHEVEIMTKGASMLPFIRGEVDCVKLTREGEFLPGDIVLARVGKGVYVLHRLEARLEDGTVVLHGDGNLDSREKCRYEDICGKVSKIVRPSGREYLPSVGLANRWNALPRIVRRVFLALYRRIMIPKKRY